MGLRRKRQQTLGVKVVVVVVEVMLAIAELRPPGADFRQLADQANDRLPVGVVEIVPAHRSIEHHAPVAAAGIQ